MFQIILTLELLDVFAMLLLSRITNPSLNLELQIKCVFLGYPYGIKGYKVLNLSTDSMKHLFLLPLVLQLILFLIPLTLLLLLLLQLIFLKHFSPSHSTNTSPSPNT